METLLGRRRYFPELQPGSSAPHGVRQSAERMAINAPIQGTAADIIKIAMIQLHRALEARGLQARIILQVHDDLVLETPSDERKEVSLLMRDIMEAAVQLHVPLKVDFKIGSNWGEMASVSVEPAALSNAHSL